MDKRDQLLREIALFWRSIWIGLHSPRSGIVTDSIRRARCKYHYAIRKNKNNNLKLRKEAMANAISQNNSRQLWDEIKKVRHINPTYSNCVDAAIGVNYIVSLFANTYTALYNSVCYEYHEMSSIRNDIRYDIDKYCIKQEDDEIFTHTHNIIIDDVRLAIQHKQI